MIGNHALHRSGEVSVDHHGIGSIRAGGGANSHRATASEQDFFYRFVEADFNPETLGDTSHCRRDGCATANGMEHAVFIFEEAQDAEEARATERRHAEVFRLETERESHALYTRCAETFAVLTPSSGSLYNSACCYALAGDKARAFETLEKAVEHGWLEAARMQQDADLKTLRADPRWKSLISRAADK